jgi:PAS domain S-box-containing protein
MNDADFQVALGDPRIAAYAASPLPAWLWSADGARVLWANAAGARVFGAVDALVLAGKVFGPADQHRRHIARLAHRLPVNGAIRMERLQGFGASLGMLATCGCSRLDFGDGSHGVLIAAGNVPVPAHITPQKTVTLAQQPVAASAAFVAQPTAVVPTAFRAEAIASETDTAEVRRTETPAVPAPAHGPVTDDPAAAIAMFDAFAEPPEFPNIGASNAEPVSVEPAAPTEPDLGSVLQLDLPHVEATRTKAPRTETRQANAPSSPQAETHRVPLRFVWQMDRDARFMLGANEFTHLIGPRTSAGFGRPWREIAEAFDLDPAGEISKAVSTRETWSGITLSWPVDGGERLPVELSGLPIFDSARNFAGYRGFGVCRDFDAMARLATLRHDELSHPIAPVEAAPEQASAPTAPFAELPEPVEAETSHPTDLDTPVETKDTMTEALTELPADAPKNVLPFRAPGDAIKPPSLTPVENSAFNELARQLSARLETENGNGPTIDSDPIFDTPVEAFVPATPGEQPEWLVTPEPPARGEGRRDKALLDLLPVGILIYRLDRLLYANPAFLTQLGYPSLHALEDAGGLDALYVGPGVSSVSSTSDTGTPVTIAASLPQEAETQAAAEARLYTISWDGDSALALIFSGTRHESQAIAAALAQAAPAIEPAEAIVDEPEVSEPSPVGHANAEELAAILDTTAEGIVMFDAEGNISSANRSAEALFGHDGDELSQLNLADLFAPESRHGVFDYLAGIKSSDAASLLGHGREVLGRESKGGIIPLSMTMGRTRADGPNFFAVFRDLSQTKRSESELHEARRLADRSATAKADVLARISHEVRTPLNAIIGFSEVMIGERFGSLGNERYVEYMKDIRASGERVIAIIDDLLDLSRIETGKLDLAFTAQNLNELVESCVAVMQPQANRERIIIRTSLAHTLPPVIADGRALRQITLNLIGNSIHLANAGGQVIVSTALSDFGEVMLRVRDTGHGLNDNEVAAALEPFRTAAPSDQSEGSGVSLSLTKALVEANRAKFQIKTGGRSGTLIEVVFPHAVARV